jgi:hypothetical protein
MFGFHGFWVLGIGYRVYGMGIGFMETNVGYGRFADNRKPEKQRLLRNYFAGSGLQGVLNLF